MDKLMVRKAPTQYLVNSYHAWPQIVNLTTIADWHDWMCSRTDRDIVWRCLWLMLPTMTCAMLHFSGVEFMGLTRVAYYFPNKILQQIGQKQVIPSNIRPYPLSFAFWAPHLKAKYKAW
ncbi:hypothetical protein CsSME_00037765 [Camellia sinensis var. sinensis]